MNAERALSVLAVPDQWARCSHQGTALLDGGGVELAWDNPSPPAGEQEPPGPGGAVGEGPSGLAFDRWCRAYRSRPTLGRIEVLAEGTTRSPAGEPGSPRPGVLRVPRGLAIDGSHQLYAAEAGAGAVHVVDLWSQRLRRRVNLRSPRHRRRRPVDVAATCCGSIVLLHGPVGLIRLEGRRGPLPGPALAHPPQAGRRQPTRVASRGRDVLLLWAGTGCSAIIASAGGVVVATVEGATDLDVAPDGSLIVACAAGQPFRRFRRGTAGWSEIEPLGAPGYDGGAIAIAPDGRLAFTTPAGLGWTTGAQLNYAPSGRVVGYRMDAVSYRTRWGRIFLDACIPPGTEVRARFLTSDDDSVPDPLPIMPPSRGGGAVPAPDAAHPMPSQVQLAELTTSWPLHRRSTGREWPWAQIAADDTFETYEAPVNAPPGRYLWVVLELAGSQRSSPRVRTLRVERPGHQLLGQLPRTWSRDEANAAFLHRFLTPAEGMLHGLDEDAATREVLVDPAAAPQEALDWLASFTGLVLDRRWPDNARRALIAEAFQLFRVRGTQAGLERLLELYLGYPVPVIEAWRLRGLGGAVLGTSPGGPQAPYVGGAARSSGALGRFVVGGTSPKGDGYKVTAHRFSVLIPAELHPEQRDVVRSIVEDHKPAHTLAEICELGVGMRVGSRLHVQLTSVVGPGAWWGPAIVGQVLVGGDGVVGLPAVGARLSSSSEVGKVRVG